MRLRNKFVNINDSRLTKTVFKWDEGTGKKIRNLISKLCIVNLQVHVTLVSVHVVKSKVVKLIVNEMTWQLASELKLPTLIGEMS